MKKFAFAAAVLASGVSGAYAADLIVDEAPVMAAPASSPSIYVQLLGGVTGSLDMTFFDGSDYYDDATDVGYALAGTIGVVVMDGLSLEADVFATSRNMPDFEDSFISSASLMANAKFTVPVNDTFSLYGAAGVGFIKYNDHFEGDDGSFSGVGYQLIAGVAAEVADNTSLVGELRYQNTFSEAGYDDGPDDYTLQVPTVSALVGLKFGF